MPDPNIQNPLPQTPGTHNPDDLGQISTGPAVTRGVPRIGELAKEVVTGGVVLDSWEKVHQAIWEISGITPETQHQRPHSKSELADIKAFVNGVITQLREPGLYRLHWGTTNSHGSEIEPPWNFQRRHITIDPCQGGWVFGTLYPEDKNISGSLKAISKVADGQPVAQHHILSCILNVRGGESRYSDLQSAVTALNQREGIQAHLVEQDESLFKVTLSAPSLTYTFKASVYRDSRTEVDVTQPVENPRSPDAQSNSVFGYDVPAPTLVIECLSDTGRDWVETELGISKLPEVTDFIQQAFLEAHNGAPYLSEQELAVFRGDLTRFPVAEIQARAKLHMLTLLAERFELKQSSADINECREVLTALLEKQGDDGVDILSRIKEADEQVRDTMHLQREIARELAQIFDMQGLEFRSESDSLSDDKRGPHGSGALICALLTAAIGYRDRSEDQHLPGLEAMKSEIERLIDSVTLRIRLKDDDERRVFIALQNFVNRREGDPLADVMDITSSREAVLRELKSCCNTGSTYRSEDDSSSSSWTKTDALRQRVALIQAGILAEDGKPTPATKAVAKYIVHCENGLQLDGAQAQV